MLLLYFKSTRAVQTQKEPTKKKPSITTSLELLWAAVTGFISVFISTSNIYQ